jgi:hypothetical protein
MSCTGKTPTCTQAELNAVYSATIIPLNLSTDDFGMIDATALTAAITKIMTDNQITKPNFTTSIAEPTMDEVTEFNTRLGAFFTKLEAEYNYYDARYRYSIDRYISAIIENGSNATESADMAKFKAFANTYNKKMNILIQLAQGLSERAYADARDGEGQIQEMNATLNERAATIKKHSELLKKNISSMELRKQMVEYTQEKARATENLLSLYFVLNVFAIGALLYVYKA